ncbi:MULTISPECIES: helix-turn-helix transcriptional regulator [Bacillus]|nr:hypothetical protein [Bacillus altitudinis]MEC1184240.1 hypothetical protein [Bacillus altitudinis]
MLGQLEERHIDFENKQLCMEGTKEIAEITGVSKATLYRKIKYYKAV